MKRMHIVLSVVVGTALIAGCSGGLGRLAQEKKAPATSESFKEAPPAPADGAGVTRGAPAQPGGGAGSLSNLPQERMVIKNATLAVRVSDVPAAFARAVQLADAGGGYVQTSTQSEEDGQRADVTIRVPPHGFLPLIASLGALGTVTTKTITGEDVTQEYYDLGAELDNQVEVRGRLFQLLKQAVKVADAISVEEQLERVGANVNRIKGRMKYLETMTGMSTIDVSLYGEQRAATEGFINWSLVGHGFWRAAQILVGAFFVILQVLVVAIPLVLVLGAAAWGGIIVVRRARRWRGLPGLSGDEGRASSRTVKAATRKR